MRCELRLHRAGRAKGGVIKCVQILPDSARRIRRVKRRRFPIVLRRGVLPIGIRLDQAGIRGKTLAAGQPFLNAARDHGFEDMPQEIAVAETPTPVFREDRVIRHRIGEIEAAEPAVRKVQVNFFAKPPLGSDAHSVPHQKHSDDQFRIQGRPAGRAVIGSLVLAENGQVHKLVNHSQHVVTRHMILNGELIEQCTLSFLPRSHHRHQSRIPM